MRYWWVAGVVSVWVAAGCSSTRNNPDFCCFDPADCADFGVDDVRSCDSARVCVDHLCVDAECAAPADCPAEQPYCANRLCSATCSTDPDCNGIDGRPHCDGSGACVACAADDQCPPTAPVCDPNDQTCRTCASDDECASGICLEAEGTCAAEADTVYVSMGGTDVGECTSAAPCLSVTYALTRIDTQRNVLRLVGTDYATEFGIYIDKNLYLDAPDTALSVTTPTSTVLRVGNQARVTIEHILIASATGGALSIGGDVKLWRVQVRDSNQTDGTAGIYMGGGNVEVYGSEIIDTTLDCEASTTAALTVTSTNFEVLGKTGGGLTASGCGVQISRSTFKPLTLLSLDGGTATIENNVLLRQSGQTNYTLSLVNVNGTFRFNTLATRNTSGVDNVIHCVGGSADIFTSNIVAVKSVRPITTGSDCAFKYSLFDTDAMTVPGTTNLSQAFGSIFVDPANNDYHPAATSLALGAAEQGLDVTDDFDGNPRPQPAGANPDIGAYEVP